MGYRTTTLKRDAIATRIHSTDRRGRPRPPLGCTAPGVTAHWTRVPPRGSQARPQATDPTLRIRTHLKTMPLHRHQHRSKPLRLQKRHSCTSYTLTSRHEGQRRGRQLRMSSQTLLTTLAGYEVVTLSLLGFCVRARRKLIRPKCDLLGAALGTAAIAFGSGRFSWSASAPGSAGCTALAAGE